MEPATNGCPRYTVATRWAGPQYQPAPCPLGPQYHNTTPTSPLSSHNTTKPTHNTTILPSSHSVTLEKNVSFKGPSFQFGQLCQWAIWQFGPKQNLAFPNMAHYQPLPMWAHYQADHCGQHNKQVEWENEATASDTESSSENASNCGRNLISVMTAKCSMILSFTKVIYFILSINGQSFYCYNEELNLYGF